MKVLITLLLLLTTAYSISINLEVNGIVDNREYFDEYAEPGTIFGIQENGTVTFDKNKNHLFTAGLTWFQQFGQPVEEWKAFPLFYYNYKSDHSDFLFGSFIRNGNLLYSTLFMDERYNYYRPQVEGFSYKYLFKRGVESIWVDWDSRQTTTRNEMFFVGVSGIVRWNKFSFEHYLLYRHHAGRDVEPHDPVGESGGGEFIFKYENREIKLLDTLQFIGEVIGSYNRDTRDDPWNDPLGIQFSSRVVFHHLGLQGLYYKGVYKSINWHQFEFGQPFYNAPEFGEITFLLYPIQNKYVNMVFNWEVTFVDKKVENRQYFLLTGNFGHSFRKKKSDT